MKEAKVKAKRIARRTSRIRRKVLARKNGSARLTVFRSNKHIYAQIIDDVKGSTLVAASEKEVGTPGNKVLKAEELGKVLAEKAAKKKIKNVVFDKGSYRYHGRIKALAEGARKGGLEF